MIGSQSNDPREVQAALGQLTLKQQETYRHDRREKSDSAQKKVRNQLYKTSIPKILRRKLSGSAVSGREENTGARYWLMRLFLFLSAPRVQMILSSCM